MNSQIFHEDMRSRRTKRALYDAIMRLLEKHPLGEITVNDICKEAMVHRTTLYKYFQSKTDLLEYALIQNFDEFKTQMQSLPGKNRMLETCDLAIDFIDTHKNCIRHIIDHAFISSIPFDLDRFGEIVTQHVAAHWKDLGYPALSSHVSSRIIGQFYAGGIASFILWWIREGNTISKEEIKSYLHEIFHSLRTSDVGHAVGE